MAVQISARTSYPNLNLGLLIRTILLALALLLSGCAAPHHVRPDILEKAKEPLACTSKMQCDHYWQRAKAWLMENSRYPIRTETESVIATAKPTEVSPYLVYKITRMNKANGSGEIKISADCGSDLGCIPDKWEAIYDIRAFLLEDQEMKSQ